MASGRVSMVEITRSFLALSGAATLGVSGGVSQPLDQGMEASNVRAQRVHIRYIGPREPKPTSLFAEVKLADAGLGPHRLVCVRAGESYQVASATGPRVAVKALFGEVKNGIYSAPAASPPWSMDILLAFHHGEPLPVQHLVFVASRKEGEAERLPFVGANIERRGYSTPLWRIYSGKEERLLPLTSVLPKGGGRVPHIPWGSAYTVITDLPGVGAKPLERAVSASANLAKERRELSFEPRSKGALVWVVSNPDAPDQRWERSVQSVSIHKIEKVRAAVGKAQARSIAFWMDEKVEPDQEHTYTLYRLHWDRFWLRPVGQESGDSVGAGSGRGIQTSPAWGAILEKTDISGRSPLIFRPDRPASF